MYHYILLSFNILVSSYIKSCILGRLTPEIAYYSSHHLCYWTASRNKRGEVQLPRWPSLISESLASLIRFQIQSSLIVLLLSSSRIWKTMTCIWFFGGSTGSGQPIKNPNCQELEINIHIVVPLSINHNYTPGIPDRLACVSKDTDRSIFSINCRLSKYPIKDIPSISTAHTTSTTTAT